MLREGIWHLFPEILFIQLDRIRLNYFEQVLKNWGNQPGRCYSHGFDQIRSKHFFQST